MRTRHILFSLSAAALACAAMASGAAAATTYTFVDLGPGPNGKDGYGYGASATAQVGTYFFKSYSCGKDCSGKWYDAVAWTGPGSTPVDITPPNYTFAWAYGAAGSVIVGTAVTNDGGYFGYPHAIVWKGSTHQYQDINPNGNCGSCAPGSHAYGTDGKYIVGSGGSSLHALLWNIAQLTSPVDLNPSGYYQSEAYAIHGGMQVGYAYSSTTNTYHAMLWRGTAASAIDLTPSTVTTAFATGLASTTEVGAGMLVNSSVDHAFLWHGTAASLVDLHPSGFTDSIARATHGGIQVGYGHVAGTNVLHALLWKGSARSAIDLQQFAPSTISSSQAYAVDPSGDIIGSALSTTTNTWHAVMWIPTARLVSKL